MNNLHYAIMASYHHYCYSDVFICSYASYAAIQVLFVTVCYLGSAYKINSINTWAFTKPGLWTHNYSGSDQLNKRFHYNIIVLPIYTGLFLIQDASHLNNNIWLR